MPLNSRTIIKRLRGSETGKAPFFDYSLGAYLVANFGAMGGKKGWVIECSNPTIESLTTRNLPLFRIGIYHDSLSAKILVEDDRTDQIIQGYTISVFKQMARADGYDEEEELNFYDMADAVMDWANTYLQPTALTLDEDGCPTLFDFRYVSQSQIQRSNEQKYIYQEFNFQATRQMRL